MDVPFAAKDGERNFIASAALAGAHRRIRSAHVRRVAARPRFECEATRSSHCSTASAVPGVQHGVMTVDRTFFGNRIDMGQKSSIFQYDNQSEHGSTAAADKGKKAHPRHWSAVGFFSWNVLVRCVF